MRGFIEGIILFVGLRVPVIGAVLGAAARSPPQAQHAGPLGVTLLVIANENSLGVLRVALCTWIRADFHPTDVVLAADFDAGAIKGSQVRLILPAAPCSGITSCLPPGLFSAVRLRGC